MRNVPEQRLSGKMPADRQRGYRVIVRIFLMTALLLCAADMALAESWVKYSSTAMNFPSGDRIIRGNSESFYDTDSARYYDRTHVEIRLKHVTYIGDLVPHISRELIRIDCMTNGFESLTHHSPDDPAVLTVINRGEIGSDSAYRVIREVYCGVPAPRR
jgi:hypothetical protein